MVVNLCPEKCSKSIQYTVRKSQKVRQSNERNIISSVVTSKPQSHGYICESAFVLLLHSKHHGLTVFALNTKTLGCPPKCMFFSPRWTQVRSLENITQYAACSLISVLHFSAILATLLEWIDLSKLTPIVDSGTKSFTVLWLQSAKPDYDIMSRPIYQPHFCSFELRTPESSLKTTSLIKTSDYVQARTENERLQITREPK